MVVVEVRMEWLPVGCILGCQCGRNDICWCMTTNYLYTVYRDFRIYDIENITLIHSPSVVNNDNSTRRTRQLIPPHH
jgi:hypothetical protein